MFASKAFAALALLGAMGAVQATPINSSCKYLPGDYGWPSQSKWAQLNSTVGGRLIQTIPLGSVCHSTGFGDYNADACKAVQDEWTLPETYETHAAEVMNPYYQNTTCTPFYNLNDTCTLGNYASYSINVSGVADVQAGIKFAADNNIRLVVKNTGHDFMGRNLGSGSLSLWMHNHAEVTVIENYNSSTYSGPAAKLNAGAVAGNVYETVNAYGYRILGGSCLSVGLAGGYTPGGGHSLLNSMYGMAADAVLEWEVVTADGTHLIATPDQNSDLYWALSGGGAGTYAIALSMTSKVYPETQIGSGSLTFNASVVGNDTFWEGVGDMLAFFPTVVDTPGGMDFQIANNSFEANNIVLPNLSSEQVLELFTPLLETLDGRGIEYVFTPESYDSYFDHVQATLSPLPYGPYPTTIQLTTRLIPRTMAEDSVQRAAIMDVFQTVVDTGEYGVGCRALNVANITHPDNAVLPQWRSTVALCNFVGYWRWELSFAQNQALKSVLVNDFLPALDAVTPGAGSYLNEIDTEYTGDFKTELYGTNYDKLLSIKDKYDPNHLFYAHFAVGSTDYWTVDKSGRLCSA